MRHIALVMPEHAVPLEQSSTAAANLFCINGGIVAAHKVELALEHSRSWRGLGGSSTETPGHAPTGSAAVIVLAVVATRGRTTRNIAADIVRRAAIIVLTVSRAE